MSAPHDERTDRGGVPKDGRQDARQDARLAWSPPTLDHLPIGTTAGQRFSDLADGLLSLTGGS